MLLADREDFRIWEGGMEVQKGIHVTRRVEMRDWGIRHRPTRHGGCHLLRSPWWGCELARHMQMSGSPA